MTRADDIKAAIDQADIELTEEALANECWGVAEWDAKRDLPPGVTGPFTSPSDALAYRDKILEQYRKPVDPLTHELRRNFVAAYGELHVEVVPIWPPED